MPKEIERPEDVVKTTPIIPKPVEQISKLAGLKISRVDVPVKDVVRGLSTEGLSPKEAANKVVCSSAFTGMFENMDPATKRFTQGLELYSILKQQV